MAFVTGLVNRLSQGLEQRLRSKREEEQRQKLLAEQRIMQEQNQQQALKQDQLLFEQNLRQQQEALPAQLDMQKKTARSQAEIQQEIARDFQKLPQVNDPEYLQAMQNNDLPKMMQIAAQKPELNAHLQEWWKMVGKHSQMMSGAIEKEKALQDIRTQGFADRQKLKPESGKSSSGGSGKTATAKAPKLSEQDKYRLSRIKQRRGDIMRQLEKEQGYPDADQQKISDLNLELQEIDNQERLMFEQLPTSPAQPMPGAPKKAAASNGATTGKGATMSEASKNFLETLKSIKKQLEKK